MTYDDGRIACTDDALVIRRYYFPVGDKRIPYGAIERVRSRTVVGVTWPAPRNSRREAGSYVPIWA
jgi:hypothetical protein